MAEQGQDRIVLEGLEFHGFHGVFEKEAKFGARFTVDIELFLPLSSEDRLSATVDYSEVYALVRREVTERRYGLIEALADAIAASILNAQTKVDSIKVRVHKPHAPLPGIVQDVFVEVVRQRDG